MDNEILLEKKLEKKAARRDKKSKRRMKVSGKNVLKLKKIIEKKIKWAGFRFCVDIFKYLW